MLAKPVIGAGDIQIGVGKARLYGLLDEKVIKPHRIAHD